MTVTSTDHPTGQLFAEDPFQTHLLSPESKEPMLKIHKQKIFWKNVFILTYFHLAALFGLYLVMQKTKWQTLVFAFTLYMMSRIGITAGVHRLWSHRSFKANLPLQALLMLFFTLAFEGKVYVWVRDHRVHHKYQETDADPYNATRGLWFSHVGWLLQSKHPHVIEKGKSIDMSDLEGDSLVMFQKKYYWILVYVLCMFLPSTVPVFCWNESFNVAWHVAVCLRCAVSFNATWLVNSAAHKFGSRPYDVNLFAAENKHVSFLTLGEGWHNYHHTFPWDYKASELGSYSLNLTTGFIDFFAKIGWAYDLKTASPEMIQKRATRTGDGSHEADLWGWGDKDMAEMEKSSARIVSKIK